MKKRKLWGARGFAASLESVNIHRAISVGHQSFSKSRKGQKEGKSVQRRDQLIIVRSWKTACETDTDRSPLQTNQGGEEGRGKRVPVGRGG